MKLMNHPKWGGGGGPWRTPFVVVGDGAATLSALADTISMTTAVALSSTVCTLRSSSATEYTLPLPQHHVHPQQQRSSTSEGKEGQSISILPIEDWTCPHRAVLEVDRKPRRG